jgi:transposase
MVKMALSKQNTKIVQEAVSLIGDSLKGKLPPCKEHPDRNPYAHIWKEIKDHFGKSYKYCDDSDLEQILKIVLKCAKTD